MVLLVGYWGTERGCSTRFTVTPSLLENRCTNNLKKIKNKNLTTEKKPACYFCLFLGDTTDLQVHTLFWQCNGSMLNIGLHSWRCLYWGTRDRACLPLYSYAAFTTETTVSACEILRGKATDGQKYTLRWSAVFRVKGHRGGLTNIPAAAAAGVWFCVQ